MNTCILLVVAAAGSGLAETVPYAGVNIAGLDFGMTTSGKFPLSHPKSPGNSGIDQMKHFVTDDGLNAFRLPVAWQYLLNHNLGGLLDPINFATYDWLVQGCLNSGADMCIIDVHNYARWNGSVIGEHEGPSNTQFASLWSQIATKYVLSPKVAFGIMNEPHGLDVETWADTAQAAVTAIRKAGCREHKILLPGIDWSSASAFTANGTASVLKKIENLDGSNSSLIFEVHQYLDYDGDGTHPTCTTNNSAALQKLGDWLRANGRKAFLTETGGGANESSCLTKLCEQFDTMNEYNDVYLGWLGWAAGEFNTSYELSETPMWNGHNWTDQELVTQCIAGKFNSSSKPNEE